MYKCNIVLYFYEFFYQMNYQHHYIRNKNVNKFLCHNYNLLTIIHLHQALNL